ncbi:MAG: M23 family peptidase, partial [Dorea sp.]
MNQKQRPKKRKRGATAAVLCFVAAIAIVGTYTFKDYKETKQMEELAQAQEQLEAQAEAEGQSEKANADDIV